MQRKLEQDLALWARREDRKPLIIFGARQVGKSYLVHQFGKRHFTKTLSFNFESDAKLCQFFEKEIQPQAILQYLELISQEPIEAGSTLLFFDEIQCCPRALSSLKYFCELAPEYHVIAAGSLLGVALKREQYSFPVGKVQEMQLFPMDFEEYLWAMGHRKLADLIREHFQSNLAMEEPLHQLCLEEYRRYCVIGGMPEVLRQFIDSKSYLRVQEIQQLILNQYIADMAKYASSATSVKIRACFQSMPAQLAKNNTKFQYKVVKSGGSAALFGEAIDWLCDAGICLKCTSAAHAELPLKAYYELSNFKLYLGDIGLLCQHAGMPVQSVLNPGPHAPSFMGALAENYVAQALKSNGTPLSYWFSDGKAEIDYLLQSEDKIIPIEVKAGTDVRSRSLSVIMQRYSCKEAIRLSQKNFGLQGGVKAIPLYAAFCLESGM